MARPLFLTSPHMRGADVTALQRVLKDNAYGMFLEGAADGELGPETMRAIKRAQFWIGYGQKGINGVAGPLLVPILTGKRKLRTDQAARRRARVLAKKKTPLRVKAARAMLAAPDEKEDPPNSNNCSTSRWYGIGPGAWCMMDVARFYVKVGSKAFGRGLRWAYVPWFLQAARRGEHGLAITANPQFGDPFVVDWNRNGVYDHAGLFLEWIDRAAGRFKTREGNTAIGNDSDGGQRLKRDRKLTDGHFIFVHVSR